MGLLNTIKRSQDDYDLPSKKSYWGYEIDVSLIDVERITQKVNHLPSEKRALLHELSGLEPVDKVLIIKNKKKNLGRLTTYQVKEILDDMGFNVDTIFSG